MVYKVQKKRRFSKKQWLILATSTIFVAVVTALILEKTHVIDIFSEPTTQTNQPATTNTINYTPATTEDAAISNDVKQNDSEDSSQATTQNLQLTLTRVTQDETTRELVVRALIEGTLSGTCKLELIKDGSTTLTRTASVVQQNNFATCQGFNVLPAEFPSLGEFTIKLTVTSGSSSTFGTQIIVLEQ